ncbi:gamma-butyrobetaine dioxygenase-like isoform X2 [Stegodyphus dumicola]|uniref:gamma-butyrobetaine dioxygenase-like isoform X2 n=1 Tax=Stegodyphus dumicola TaxID=202533 RepID=UPI0015B18677|nr:gamma-butyrobetaine dioxygenase-like isoform X2 [Stegodyphus dumicola]
MMRLKSLCSLYQFGARQSFRGLVKPTNMKIKLLRDIHKTGYRTRATAAINPNFQPVCITKTFPTSHQSLKIGFEDNLASDFQYIWLRDNCQCEKCIHPVSRQKMLDTVSLNINIKPKSYHLTENGKLKIVWPDGDGEHVSFYDPQWLHKYGKGFELDSYDYVHDSLPPMVTWNGETIKKIMPEISYKEVMETEQGLKTWLEMIYKYGLAILKGLQALHCLKANPSSDSDSIGGQSFFVDGFYIAKWLRKEHPASFHVLTSTLVEFKIYSHNMEYCNNQYVLCVSKTGEMQEVHYNTRTMAPLKGPADAVQPFYEAYQLMGQKMREKESEFAFNLIPGDLVAFNNRRVLHGRTSFDPRRMSRHLEGCYGDIDEIITRYRSFLKSEKP